MKTIKILLFPFAFIYGIVVYVRNLLYDYNFLHSITHQKPIICVGNISYGGTGKTPTVEYIFTLLKENFQIAILSRGYKRNSKGFVLANEKSLSTDIGDEPKQFKNKFKDIYVAVSENRNEGVKKIIAIKKDIDCIILDDAFQHRAIKAGFYLLVTDYNNLFYKDFLLPVGTLREFSKGYKRADVIIVSKCPSDISSDEKNQILRKIKSKPHQQVVFSYIKYGKCIAVYSELHEHIDTVGKTVMLFTGIGNSKPIESYLNEQKCLLQIKRFRDHHEYSDNDLINIRESFNNIAVENKILLTTEKDLMRIERGEQKEILRNLPFYYLPIEIDFFAQDKELFNQIIYSYVKNVRENQ